MTLITQRATRTPQGHPPGNLSPGCGRFSAMAWVWRGQSRKRMPMYKQHLQIFPFVDSYQGLLRTFAVWIASVFGRDCSVNLQLDFCVSKCNFKSMELKLHHTAHDPFLAADKKNRTTLMWTAFIKNNVILCKVQIYAFGTDQTCIKIHISVNWA